MYQVQDYRRMGGWPERLQWMNCGKPHADYRQALRYARRLYADDCRDLRIIHNGILIWSN